MTLRIVQLLAILVVIHAAVATASATGPAPGQLQTAVISAVPALYVTGTYAVAWSLADPYRAQKDKPKDEKKPKPIHGDEMTLPVALVSGVCVLSGYFLVSRMRKRRGAHSKIA